MRIKDGHIGQSAEKVLNAVAYAYSGAALYEASAKFALHVQPIRNRLATIFIFFKKNNSKKKASKLGKWETIWHQMNN